MIYEAQQANKDRDIVICILANKIDIISHNEQNKIENNGKNIMDKCKYEFS